MVAGCVLAVGVGLGACYDAGPGSQPTTAEQVASAEQSVSCVTIKRQQATGVVEDANLIQDPADPTKANTNYGNVQQMNTGFAGTDFRRTLMKFSLAGIPPGQIISSSTLTFRMIQSPGKADVNIHNVLAPWTEYGVTWNNLGGAFDPLPVATFATFGVPNNSNLSVDLTGLTAGWYTGSIPNNGVLFDHPAAGRTSIGSSEAPTLGPRPSLTVCYDPDPRAGVVCPAPAECQTGGTCNSATGLCEYQPAPDGSICSVGTCQAGSCVPGGGGTTKVYLTSSNGTPGFYGYDRASNAWSILASPPVVTYTQLTTDGSLVYLLGQDNVIYAYNPSTGAWSGVSNGPGGLSAQPIGFFKWTPSGFYYLKDGTSTLYHQIAGSWTGIGLSAAQSSAGSYDPVSGNLYIRGWSNLSLTVVSTAIDAQIAYYPNGTGVGENSRAGSYYNGYFYERDWSGPFMKVDVTNGFTVNTGVAPSEGHVSTDTDTSTGDIYVGPYWPTGQTFEVYNANSSSLMVLAPVPVNVSNHSTIVVVKGAVDTSGVFSQYSSAGRNVYLFKSPQCALLSNYTTYCQDRGLSWWSPRSQADAQQLISHAYSLDNSHTWIQTYNSTTTNMSGTVGGYNVTVDGTGCVDSSSSGWTAFRKWACSFCDPEAGQYVGVSQSCCWDTSHPYDWFVCED
jgi:hypothetical protein